MLARVLFCWVTHNCHWKSFLGLAKRSLASRVWALLLRYVWELFASFMNFCFHYAWSWHCWLGDFLMLFQILVETVRISSICMALVFGHFRFKAASSTTTFVWGEGYDLFACGWYGGRMNGAWRWRFLDVSKEILLQWLSNSMWNSFWLLWLARRLLARGRSSIMIMTLPQCFFIIQISRCLASFLNGLTSITPHVLYFSFHYFLPIMLFLFTEHLLHQFIDWIERQFNSLVE